MFLTCFIKFPCTKLKTGRVLSRPSNSRCTDQVKSGFPKDLAEASLLTRIAPLRVLGKMLHLPLKGRMATFVFSHLGKSLYQSTEFMDGSVENIFHMPRVPVPPGLGFFSNYYDGRLNLVISYLDGLLAEGEVSILESGIRKRFGVY